MPGSPLKRYGLTRGISTGDVAKWRDHLPTMARLDLHIHLLNQFVSPEKVYEAVNKHLVQSGQKPITWRQFRKDRERVGVLLQERVQAGAVQHLSVLQQLSREQWRDYYRMAPKVVNGEEMIENRRMEVRTKIGEQLRQTVRTMAEIDGSMVTHVKYDADVDVTIAAEPSMEDLVEAARLAIEMIPGLAPQRRQEVIDVTPRVVEAEGGLLGLPGPSEAPEVITSAEMLGWSNNREHVDWTVGSGDGAKGRSLP